MPTTIAHSILGLTTSVLFYWRGRKPWRQSLAAFWTNHRWAICLGVFCADFPDLDLVPGFFTHNWSMYHRLYTHTLLAVVLLASLCWLVWRYFDRRISWRDWCFLFLCGCSHFLADWLGEDFRPPYGIMLFWPFSSEYYICRYSYFADVKKDSLWQMFSWSNAWVVAGEFLKTTPLLFLAAWGKWRRE